MEKYKTTGKKKKKLKIIAPTWNHEFALFA